MRRGILTLATGQLHYIELAKNLGRSLKMNGPKLPTAIITDSIDPEIKDIFDIIIPADNSFKNIILDKLNIYEYTPFEETMFIDADCLVIKDFSFLWDLFKGRELATLGYWRTTPYHFFDLNKVKKDFEINGFPAFNGGVYMFKKSNRVSEVFKLAKELIPKYQHYNMPMHGGRQLNEEPLMSLAMAIYNIHPIEDEGRGMICTPGQTHISIDVLSNKCKLTKYGKVIEPCIMHFGTGYTHLFHYKREVMKIMFHLRYPSIPKIIISFLINIRKNPGYILLVLRHRIYSKKVKNRIFPLMPMNLYDLV